MIVAPLIPIITTLNAVYQQQRKREESRRQREHEEKAKPNYNGTSCVQVVYDANYACCFYPPLPSETPANMVTVCGVY